MRDYGKVKTTTWADDKVRYDMSSDERVLFLYLLTSPHTTALGCFYCPDGYILEDLQWTSDRITRSKDSLTRLQCARFDRTGWVWLPNFLTHNKPENGSVWRHIRKLAAGIPERVVFRSEVLASAPDRENETPCENLTDEKQTRSPEVPSEPNLNRTQPNRTQPNPTESPHSPPAGGGVVLNSGGDSDERPGRGRRRNRPRSLREALAADDEIRAEVETLAKPAGNAGNSTSAEAIGGGQGRDGEGLRQVAGLQIRGPAQGAGSVQVGGAVRRDDPLGGIPAAEGTVRHAGNGPAPEVRQSPRVMGVEGRQTSAAVVGGNVGAALIPGARATTVPDGAQNRVARLQ